MKSGIANKLFSCSVLALFLSACGGSGGSDDIVDVNEDKSYIGMNYLAGATVVDEVEFSVFRWDGFRSQSGIHYQQSSCRIHGLYEQDGKVYDNGYMYTRYKNGGSIYESVCHIKSAQREVQVSDSQQLNIAYMGGKFFYDNYTGYIYEVSGLNLNPSNKMHIGEILNGGANAKIVFSNGATETVAIERVLVDVDLSELGITLPQPSHDFFKGNEDYIMEFGYSAAAYDKPYTFEQGSLFLYKDSGCSFTSLRSSFYVVFNDGTMYERDDWDGSESYCVVDKFFQYIKPADDESVHARYTRRGVFYDSATGIYYEVEGANTFSGYFITEIINDGRSAIVYSSESSDSPMVLLVVRAYKEYFPDF